MLIENQVEINFQTPAQAKQFAEWFRKEGFNRFLKSTFNKAEVSCLATDEKPKEGVCMNHYFEVE